jgi:hypothetical protein
MQYAREKTRDGHELVDFAYSVFKGEPQPMVIRKTLPDGTIAETKFDATPSLEQRFEAMTFLADRAFGKPAQKLEGEIRAPLSIIHRTPPHDPLAPKPDEERALPLAPKPDEERALDVEATLVPPRRALKP